MTGLLKPEIIYSQEHAVEIVTQVPIIELPVSVLLIDTGVQRYIRLRGQVDVTALFADRDKEHTRPVSRFGFFTDEERLMLVRRLITVLFRENPFRGTGTRDEQVLPQFDLPIENFDWNDLLAPLETYRLDVALIHSRVKQSLQ